MSDSNVTIHKVFDHKSNFVFFPNSAAQNENLSYEARGLLVYLLSLPMDWKVYVKTLQRKGCGRDKLRRVMNELQDTGYLYLEHLRDENGQMAGSQWLVYGDPSENPHYTPENTDPLKNRPSEKPTVGKPAPTKETRIQKKEKDSLSAGALSDKKPAKKKAKQADKSKSGVAKGLVLHYRRLSEDVRPIPHVMNDYHESAIPLAEAGITTKDLHGFYDDTMQWWTYNNAVSWGYICKNILAWKTQANKPKPKLAPVTDIEATKAELARLEQIERDGMNLTEKELREKYSGDDLKGALYHHKAYYNQYKDLREFKLTGENDD